LAFADYRKAFDSIEFWAIMRSLDNSKIDSRYKKLLKYIYDHATASVKIDEDLKTDQIHIEEGIRRWDNILPKLFTLALENVFKTLNWDDKGINIDGIYLNHLRFADDIILMSGNITKQETLLEELQQASQRVGLEMNIIYF